ncbi:MAG: hypothetical protein A3C36_04630 [Omnitrophica WOR_2 bacterium RIFCSPHIGHO2_02_FULL_52_10]|nr:MAG: hypothetical protein A3C36_04630 [Omnitrophica WOR_2 bacterium RIFCSPHIGHO2_02_FULL_52_10]
MRLTISIVSRNFSIFAGILLFSAITASAVHAEFNQPTPLTSPQCNKFTFDASRSRIVDENNVAYFWDLGDGTTSAEPVVTHVYRLPGEYTVRLSLTDNPSGTGTISTATKVVRALVPPKVSFTSGDYACVHKSLFFDATGSSSTRNRDLRYFWDFGDGTAREGSQVAKKTFSSAGEYTVTLTVDDQTQGQCSWQTAQKTIYVNAPPTAEAGDDVLLKCVKSEDDLLIEFDASRSTDANSDSLAFFWDFGDGLKGKGRQVTHRYRRAGNYEATLVVSDTTGLQCSMDADFISIRLNEAPIARTGEDASVCLGEKVSFNGSNSYVHKPGAALARWSFGDGTTADGLQATHRYDRPGTFEAVLTLESKFNGNCPSSRDTRQIHVNSPPEVSIRGPETACAGEEVFFDAAPAQASDGAALKYYWNFGDGASSQSGSSVKHAYALGGAYRVSLVVDDQKGSPCSTATAYMNLDINTPPEADAGKDAADHVGKDILFSAGESRDPDGDQLTYLWDFGDGSKQQGRQVTHVYARSNTFLVTLTVEDNSRTSCSRSTDSLTAVVRDASQPVITVR